MASLKGKCKPSRSCLPGVMKIVPTIIWLSKSFGQPPLTAIYSWHHSFSFQQTAENHTSSHHQASTQQCSCQSIPQSQTELQHIWCSFWGETWPPINPANLGTGYHFQKMESRCDQIPSWDTLFLHHPDTTQWTQENCWHLKEAAVPTTIPESVSTTYNTKVSLQPVQRNVCIKPLSHIKESSNNNKRNSNVPAQCAPTPQSVPTVEKAEIKEPRRSSRISKPPEH